MPAHLTAPSDQPFAERGSDAFAKRAPRAKQAFHCVFGLPAAPGGGVREGPGGGQRMGGSAGKAGAVSGSGRDEAREERSRGGEQRAAGEAAHEGGGRGGNPGAARGRARAERGAAREVPQGPRPLSPDLRG